MFDYKTYPNLETPHLILREITLDDAPRILAIRGDVRVTRSNTVYNLNDLDEAVDLIDRTRLAYEDRRRIDWGIVLKDAPHVGLVGRIGYNYWLREDERGSIGYDVAFDYWGRGIATEAVRAVINFGFREMLLAKIDADAFIDNIASQRVLLKAGFQRLGTEREWEFGVLRELVLFTLKQRDWAKKLQLRNES